MAPLFSARAASGRDRIARAGAGRHRGRDAPDGGLQAVQVDGLGQVFGESGTRALLQVFLGAKPADGDAGQCPAAAQTVDQLEAGPVGKFDVADQEVELGLPRGGQGGREAVDRHNVVVPLLKDQREIAQGVLVILDEEDVQPGTAGRA